MYIHGALTRCVYRELRFRQRLTAAYYGQIDAMLYTVNRDFGSTCPRRMVLRTSVMRVEAHIVQGQAEHCRRQLDRMRKSARQISARLIRRRIVRGRDNMKQINLGLVGYKFMYTHVRA